MLVFKFNKNEKERRRMDGELGYGGAFEYVNEENQPNYDHFKYVSIDTPENYNEQGANLA